MPRPRVITHNVASVDGRLTIAPGVLLVAGDERWEAIAGSAEGYARVMAHYRPQVLLEGSGSLVSDDAAPDPLPPPPATDHDLRSDFLPEEVVGAPDRRWFTVVDGRGRVRWQFKELPGPEWAGWHLLVLVSEQTPVEYLAHLRSETIPHLVVGPASVELGTAVDRLAERLGAETIVSTGGGRLNGALLRAGLVDRVEVEVVPALIGGPQTPALFDAPALGPDQQPTALSLVSVDTTDEGHVIAVYDVVAERPASDPAPPQPEQAGRAVARPPWPSIGACATSSRCSTRSGWPPGRFPRSAPGSRPRPRRCRRRRVWTSRPAGRPVRRRTRRFGSDRPP